MTSCVCTAIGYFCQENGSLQMQITLLNVTISSITPHAEDKSWKFRFKALKGDICLLQSITSIINKRLKNIHIHDTLRGMAGNISYCQQIINKSIKNTSISHTIALIDMFLHYNEHVFLKKKKSAALS